MQKLHEEKSSLGFILKAASFCTLFGWAIIHLLWDTPYRGFFWSEQTLKPIIETLSPFTWTEYVTSAKTDAFIIAVGKFLGVLLLLASSVPVLPTKWASKMRHLLPLGSGILFLMYLLVFQENLYRWGNLFEHAAQIGIPVLTYLYFFSKLSIEKLKLGLKILISLTFLGHGLYALGYYPVPGHFTDMVIEILRVPESTAKQLLFLAGAIDVLLVIFLWIPRLDIFAAAYCIFWGFVTTMARPVWFVLLNVNEPEGLAHWLMQALYRGPHLLAPLALLIILRSALPLQYQKAYEQTDHSKNER